MNERSLKFIDAGTDAGLCFPVRSDYSFAQRRRTVLVGPHEMHMLVGVMPVLLTRVEEQWFLTGVMGILGHGNLLIGPQGGWLAHYVPDHLRLYPLTLARRDADAEVQLAVEADTEDLAMGRERQLVDDAGEYTELYQNLLGRLRIYRQLRGPLNTMADLLLETGLLKALGEDNLLMRADREAYGANMRGVKDLPADALEKLAQAGALDLGYAMSNSGTNITRFQKIARRRSGAGADQEVVQAMQHTDDVGFNFD